MIRILGISGSLRSASSNTRLLQACTHLAPAGVQVQIYEGLGTLPHFNADLDTETPPPEVAAFRAQVAAADAIVICSPEYARGVPGSLKNALDWLAGSADVVDKPVALLNGSPRASYSQQSLAVTLRTISANLITDTPYLAPVLGKAIEVRDIVNDPALGDVIRRLMSDLLGAVRATPA
jgi:chromate reductase, NAD(P)H dehydrogenase (quinone)